jgi:signal peptide peptidase SppA
MHQRLPLLAQRVINTPLAMHPQHAGLVMAAVAARFGVNQVLVAGAQMVPMAMEDDDFYVSSDAPARPRDKGYDMTGDVACIPVEGTLVQKNGTIRPYCGMTGYDGIRSAFINAMEDKAAKAVVLCIDSPGGEVAGCFDLADTIARCRGKKPIWAICDEVAFSAAYALASACDVISVPRTGGAGSIGVIAILGDLSRMYDKAGITVNIIAYGDRKADGNEFEALSDTARNRFQAQINGLGELFVNTVARNRDIKPEAVKATQAATFTAKEALDLSLIDIVGSPQEAFTELLAQL